MEQVLQQHVQTHVQEEQNIAQQENQNVVQFRVVTTQLDVIHQETIVRDKASVQRVIIVLVEYHIVVEQAIQQVAQEQQVVLLVMQLRHLHSVILENSKWEVRNIQILLGIQLIRIGKFNS